MSSQNSMYSDRFNDLRDFLDAMNWYDEHELDDITLNTLDEFEVYAASGLRRSIVETCRPAWNFTLRYLITPEMRVITKQYDQPAEDLAIALAWITKGKAPLREFLRERLDSPSEFVVDLWINIQRIRGHLRIEENA